jgi:hypothetical protein
MFVCSIRALAFFFLVCLSMIHHAHAACGDSGQAEFNKNGFPQGLTGNFIALSDVSFMATIAVLINMEPTFTRPRPEDLTRQI